MVKIQMKKNINKSQSNLAKGDIALVSYSPGGSTGHEVGPGGCIWDPNFGEGEFVGSQRCFHSKDRWWFPIGCPLWPLRYI